MLFKQLIELDSGETVLIDLVLDTVERDLSALKDMGVKLTYT